MRHLIWILVAALALTALWMIDGEDAVPRVEGAPASSSAASGTPSPAVELATVERHGIRAGDEGPEPALVRASAAPARVSLQARHARVHEVHTEPLFQVLDPELDGPRELGPSGELLLANAPARTVRLEPTTRGWLVDPSTIEIHTRMAGRMPVDVTSRHLVALQLHDASTGEPIEAADVAVETQWIEGCCPTGVDHGARPYETPGGRLYLEGVDLAVGRLRISAATERHFPASTGWIDVDAGLVRAELGLVPLATGAARLDLRVTDASGAAVEGAQVTLFHELGTSRVTEIMRFPGDLVVMRAGTEDTLERALESLTDAEGLARFVLPRAGTWRPWASDGSAHVLGDPLAIEPAEAREATLVLGGGASIVGRVEGPLPDVDELPESLRPMVSLRGSGLRDMQPLDADGRFRWEGLAAGTWVVELWAPPAGVDSSAPHDFGTVRSDELVLGPHEERDVVLRMPGAGDRGPRVVLPTPAEAVDWTWAVVAFEPWGAGEGPSIPLARMQGRSGETVALPALADSKLVVAALGRAVDRSAVALALDPRPRGAGSADEPVRLSLDGAPLHVENTGDRIERVRLRTSSSELEVWLADLIGELPPLQLDPGQAGRYLGLPDVAYELVRVTAGTESAPLEARPGSTVRVP